MVIQKFQYDFKVNVYKTDDELYSIFVFSRDRTDKSATTTFAKLELVSALTKDKILNKLDDYMKSKQVLHEISDSQAMFDGLNTFPTCDCCPRSISMFRSKE